MKNKLLVLSNCTMIDGLGNEPLHNATIVIKEDRIDKIMTNYVFEPNDNVEIIDCTNKVVMPGLIDAHVHLWGGRTDSVINEMGYMLEPMEVKTIRSVADAQSILKSGFTSVRDITSRNGLFLKRVFNEKTLTGPRIVACGPGLSKTGGHVDLHQLPVDFLRDKWVTYADGPEEIRKAVRMLLRDGADQIKLFISGGDCWPCDRLCDTHYSFEEIEMAVKEAERSSGTIVCAHVENETSMLYALKAGVKTLEHGEALNEEMIDLFKEKEAILVPTLAIQTLWMTEFAVDDPDRDVRPDAFLHRSKYEGMMDNDDFVELVINAFTLARKNEIPIALGSDTVRAPAQSYGGFGIKELECLVKYGMTELEAIKAATHVSSMALGIQDNVGTIEEGMIADMLILEENPLEDITVLAEKANIRYIILDGDIVVDKGILQQ